MNSLSDPRHKILRFPERLAAYRDGLAYPISAEIDLTWRCALNCKGCHSKWLHQDQELKPEEIRRILEELHRHGLKSVTWSGGGDPMESPHFEYAVNLAADLGLDQGLYTYFPAPSWEKIDFIDRKFSWVYTHPFKIPDEPDAGRRNPRALWTVGFLLDSDNWFKARHWVELSDLEFFDHIDFRPLCPTNEPGALAFKPADLRWVPQCLMMLHDLKNTEPRVTFAEYKFLDLLKPDFGRSYNTCFSTDFVAVVGPNGDMYECVQRRGRDVLGNLLREDLAAIWRRKARCRTDLSQCRLLCRNHELNKTLAYVLGPPVQHEVFV